MRSQQRLDSFRAVNIKALAILGGCICVAGEKSSGTWSLLKVVLVAAVHRDVHRALMQRSR